MFAGFYGIHGLSRDIELDREFGLTPFTLGPQDAKAVLHRIIALIISHGQIVSKRGWVSGCPDYMSRVSDNVNTT